ncbi:MAG TPA: catalase family peroxidase [Roseomonas sp.]|jgi:catalase
MSDPSPPGTIGLLARLGAIGLLLTGAAGGFAYAGGWFSPDRLTPARIVDALSQRGGDPVGHRRNHAKGICFIGSFESNGAGTHLSTARVFVAGPYPVVGRFATGTGDPRSPDAANRVRSMAIRIRTPGGQEWRSGMNNSPVFAVATPQAFYEQALAARVDPATGRPDPAALRRFAAAHPETAAFADWARTAPWTASFADQTYSSLNAFQFIDMQGQRHAVRWAMVPTTPATPTTQDALAQLGPDFLARDLAQRLRDGPLSWRLVVTLAAPGDPTNDATRAWPADRQQVELGTLVVQQASSEDDGPCRDLNFDPLVLPAGIVASDDPILLARSAAYANSFDRRAAEVGATPAPHAGEQP